MSWGYLATAIFGSLLENSVLIILSGKRCQDNLDFLNLFILLSLVSWGCDMFLLFSITYIRKRFLTKKYENFSNWKKIGIFIMLIYRFIPFARFPALILVSKLDRTNVMILNLIGAMIANLVYLSLGFWFSNH